MSQLDAGVTDPVAPILLEGSVEFSALGGRDLTQGLGRSVAWTYVHVTALAIGNLLIAGVAVRRLGADEFGYVAAITTFAGLFSVVDFGLSSSVIHATARYDNAATSDARDEAMRDVHAAHSTYVVLGAAAVAITAVASILLWARWSSSEVSADRIAVTAALFGLCASVFLATSAWIGLATGLRQFRAIAISGSVGVAIDVAVVVAALGSLGLVAVPLGQLVGMATTRGLLALFVRRSAPWFVVRPEGMRWQAMRRVYRFALPLVIMAMGAQVVAVSDIVVVGAFGSAAAVGLYRLGATLPTMVIGVLYRGYDVSFPSLAGSDDRSSQLQATAFLTRIASFVAGVGFTALVFLRGPVISVIAGPVDRMAASALAIFALVWLANTPVHGLAVLLIARREHRIMAWLVGAEATANVGFSIVFTIWLGPLGAAWATLFTLAVSNLVVLPILAVRVGEQGAVRLVWRDGVGAVAMGAAVGAVAAAPMVLVDSDIGRVATVASVSVVLGVGIGCLALGRGGRGRLKALAVGVA